MINNLVPLPSDQGVPINSPVPLHGNQDQSKSNASQFSYKHQRNFYKESTRTNRRTKLKHSAGDMIRSGTSTMICCSSTVKRSGATVEDVTPGIHTVVQYDHLDGG